MKTFEDCIAWMASVEAYSKAAPEGVFMSSNDKVITIREVEPAAIIELYTHFTTLALPAQVKYECKLEGSKDGAFCSLTIQKFGAMSYKLPNSAYRFFYRKTSQ